MRSFLFWSILVSFFLEIYLFKSCFVATKLIASVKLEEKIFFVQIKCAVCELA